MEFPVYGIIHTNELFGRWPEDVSGPSHHALHKATGVLISTIVAVSNSHQNFVGKTRFLKLK